MCKTFSADRFLDIYVGRFSISGCKIFLVWGTQEGKEKKQLHKMKYCLRSWLYKTLFTVRLFLRKSFLMGHFILQNSVSMIFFTDHCALNFSLIEKVSVFPLWKLSFWFKLIVAKLCLAHLELSLFIFLIFFFFFFFFFLTKTCFFLYITFFCKFHMVCTSQLAKIWWHASVQAWCTLIFHHFE